MRNSEYNANRDLFEAANLRAMSQPRRHAKPRPRRATLRDAVYPGTAAGLVLRLSGIAACAMALSSMVP